ncbi:hypothetical protein LTR05_001921 [Lithohypha guttulata]|uniref:Uncharacterized protein n=1 Tax=Lithohypha guttulata TaxID=1690604 RepID=A0AAN7TJ31_9EURO|nr:hypothetical protein LTR05_001921 [Lithohypha guttulata]
MISMTNTIVDRIITMSSDENKVERNLPQWRNLISRLDTEYRQIELEFSIVPHFFASGYAYHPNEPLYKQDPNLSLKQGLKEEIAVIRKRLAFALQALVSAVSVIESRRGIAEAESVTKLTELASIFSMQVRELDPATTSIRWFALTAIILIVTSYSVRLLIRSRLFVNGMHLMMSSVRREVGLRDGQPVPTITFLWWLASSPARALGSTNWWDAVIRPVLPMMILCIVCGFVPLFSLWFNARLAGGMKVVISIAIGITVISLLCVTLGPKVVRSILEMLRKQKGRRRRQKLR